MIDPGNLSRMRRFTVLDGGEEPSDGKDELVCTCGHVQGVHAVGVCHFTGGRVHVDDCGCVFFMPAVARA